MAWVTPKTDWYGDTTADGVYIGDRFNAVDFNRIKNNLEYLREMAIKLYKEFEIHALGSDRTPKDYFYAEEINQLEENLTTINSKTLNGSYGVAPTYTDNGRTMDFTGLNRIESASLDLYNRMSNQLKGRRKLAIYLGTKEDF